MCEHCNSREPAEVTEDNLPDMIDECTHLGLRAMAALANGWVSAARGYQMDAVAAWGLAGHLRLAYVWGAAEFFLPSPSKTFGEHVTTDNIRKAAQGAHGVELSDAEVSRLLAQTDVVTTLARRVGEAASKGDPNGIADVFEECIEQDDAALTNSVMMCLVTGAAARLRYSRDQGDERAYELFHAHVWADAPDRAPSTGDGDG